MTDAEQVRSLAVSPMASGRSRVASLVEAVPQRWCLGAFEMGAGTAKPRSAISVAPLVVGVGRYARDVDQGEAGEPEEIYFRDRMLQLTGLVWLVVFALGAVGA